jgi:predicted metalloenzyme YecM
MNSKLIVCDRNNIVPDVDELDPHPNARQYPLDNLDGINLVLCSSLVEELLAEIVAIRREQRGLAHSRITLMR